VEILLVEDKPRRRGTDARDIAGIEAADHMSVGGRRGGGHGRICAAEAGYLDAVRPDLILLDLNLPKKMAARWLAEIKADERLRRSRCGPDHLKRRKDILETYDSTPMYITKAV